MNKSGVRTTRSTATTKKQNTTETNDESSFLKPINMQGKAEAISKKPAPRKAATKPTSSGTKPVAGLSRHPMPVRIGHTIDSSQWRCGICTFLNDSAVEVCQTCESHKGETRRGTTSMPSGSKPTITAPSSRLMIPKKY